MPEKGRMAEVPLIIRPDRDGEGYTVAVDGWLGEQPRRFLLDTGAAGSAAALDVYTSGFPPAGTRDTGGIFSRRPERLAAAPLIRVGPIGRAPFVLALSEMMPPGCQGVLGMDFLGHFRVDLCWPRHLMTIAEPPTSGPPARHPINFGAAGHPFIEVLVGEPAQALVDTGASITLVDAGGRAAHPTRFTPLGQSQGTAAGGTQAAAAAYGLHHLSLAGHTLAPHLVAAVDLSSLDPSRRVDVLLGATSLMQVDWRLDFPRARWDIAVPSPVGSPS